MTLFLLIFFFSLVGGLFSLAGGFILLWKGEKIQEFFIHLLSFAAGAMLATAFLDLVPEAIATGLDVGQALYWTFGAFVVSFLGEGLFLRFHHHDTGSRLTSAPWMLVVSDSLHNFFDGVAIAVAFLVSVPLGIVTALAVAAHEIPQEMGDFSVMLSAGWKKARVLSVNVLSSFLTVVGALLAFLFRGTIEQFAGFFLAMTAGIFLYIGASNLIPELYHSTRRDKLTHVTALFLLGIIVVAFALHFIPE